MRRLIPAVAILAMQLCLASNARADLLGYWPFEEEEGAETTTDASGNGNDGMVIDATFAPGVRGNALDVGDASNPGRVEIPIGEDFGNGFDSIVETQSATITFWMNRQGAASHNQWTFLFDGGTDGSGAIDGRQLASHAPWSNGQIYFDTGGCCGANQRINTPLPEDVISGGDWHHLAYVRDVDDTRIYLDGALFHSSAPDVVTSPVANITRASIGASTGGGSSNTGLIDEFCIWDEALDEGRIGALAEGAGCLAEVPEPRGDFNADGVLDEADFNIMASNFNQKFGFEVAYSMGDFDQNLRVDMKDFIGFREAFQNVAGGQLAAVPEPNTFALLAMACGALLGVCRRRR